MSIIKTNGNIPRTPHTEFYAIPGVLSLEEIHGSHGFNGPFTRKYHVRSYPTEQISLPEKSIYDLFVEDADENLLAPYHILSGNIPFVGNYIEGRTPLLFGKSTIVSVSKFKKDMSEDEFFKNGEKYELLYLQSGEVTFKSEYGNISVKTGDYLIIPKGTIYQLGLKSKEAFFFIVESTFPIDFPPHYMNSSGQSTLMSSVIETEITAPEFQKPIDKQGEYNLHVKHNGGKVTCLTLSHHPYDLSGWEGALYPYAFNINDHHGIAREIHTAPPTRQTFQSGDGNTYGFSICTFRSQMEGWHPKDIPAPYAHSNVDSDEVLFFSNASYSARKGIIQEGSITLHPAALPHSPHGKAALNSMKERGKVSNMLAVMLDTFFEELSLTKFAKKYIDKNYSMSWYHANKNKE